MDSPLVSIVIPVFNGGEYLKRCLESVLGQSYSRWQAIVVNNCSTDSTGEIAEAACKRDSRLRVVHCKEFLGQSENYNRALSYAASEASYVKVLEADNWLMPECVERMVAVGETDKRTGVIGCYYVYGANVLGSGLSAETPVVDGLAACRMHLLDNVYFFGCPTSLLFRAKALHGVTIPFRPGLFHDDVDLCFRLLRTWKFGFVHQVLAYVREDNGGIFSRFWDFGFRLPMLRLLIEEYGGDYLNHEERRILLADVENRYRKQLGRALLGGRSHEYWSFHRQVFQLMGRRLRKRNLIIPGILAGLDLLLNPKSTCERLWARTRKNKSVATADEPKADPKASGGGEGTVAFGTQV